MGKENCTLQYEWGHSETTADVRDQLLLGICLYIYTDASSDKNCAFVHANGGEIYSQKRVSKRCKELELLQKRSSKESYVAFYISSIQKFNWFATLPLPLFLSGISVNKIIDINETSFYLKKTTTKYGRSHISFHVRYPAQYTRGATKINFILVVEAGSHIIAVNMDGSVQNPRRWILVTIENCDQFVFSNFMNTLLLNIKRNPAPYNIDDERVILWDNLSAQ